MLRIIQRLYYFWYQNSLINILLIFISYHNEITMLEFMLKRREDFIVNKTSQFSVAGELENSYAAGMKQDRDEWKNICVTAPCL
ncbi:hypothetical protein DRY97_15600 [Salmonella enterica subsp. arizonae]|nr:hypothetical protein [Salmonella enterica]EBJ4737118.1 hypothetical protein [Salmonella enterica]ECJ4841819.1 hypothetical protein [Salmonella enterica subsp. arizonae]